jgi:hypothetical protein
VVSKEYRGENGTVKSAVYNSGIPNMANRALRVAHAFCVVLQIFLLILVSVMAAWSADWSSPEQQLARSIVAVTGPGAMALTVENRSSLGRRDSEIIGNGLRAALESAGLRFVSQEQAAASVAISLSENPKSYVWVAEIHQGAGDRAVVMVSLPRAEGTTAGHDSAPLSLKRIPLWTQEKQILDVAVLEEGATPTHIAVLDSETVSLYRLQGGKWQLEQALALAHARPWPRDVRGRLVPARDHLLDVYLPGVFCRSTSGGSLALNCRESDDPWPLVPGSSSGAGFGAAGENGTATPRLAAFFASTRNFFTGALAPGVGKLTTVPKFYSAAPVAKDKYVLWLFASLDGQIHMVDGLTDSAAKPGWGSDVASVRTACGAGWQVLATTATERDSESIRAYELPDRDPVPVSAAMELPGPVTALWTEAKGDTGIVVTRNRESGNYEASRVAVACGQ